MTLTGNTAVAKLNSVPACGTDLTVIRSYAVTREPIRSTATAADSNLQNRLRDRHR